MNERATEARWINAVIWVGAGSFFFALVVSAIFDPTIRLLHFLQALIYVAVVFLARRKSPWGFGAGVLIAAFWNYINLFVNTFIAAGMRQLVGLVTTGRLRRPDLLIALVAAGGHFLLIAGCAVGFLRTRPRLPDWARFVAGGVLSIAYLVAIIATTGQQYMPLLMRVFRISG
ncbi:MAG TPA: hypothetical protein VLV78_23235 [Thermoanaerobaculia bacterium]|nr:hypothetical protein [Thermoanaerobaculia bacterium]